MLSPQDDLPDIAAGVLAKLREQAPRVHCITNSVAQTLTANVLLAVGAVPSMTIAAAEVTAFVAGAQALLINLGTLDAERRQAIDMTVKQAKERAMPWVLDPAFIDRIDSRAAFARVLARETPHAVRLNAREFLALGGTKPDIAALQHYAQARRVVVGMTGETDVVADGTRVATLANGHALMGQVTAMGCSASALVAACAAVEPDAWRATGAALLMFGVAGQMAGGRAHGPGSFAVEFLDALHGLNPEIILSHAKVS